MTERNNVGDKLKRSRFLALKVTNRDDGVEGRVWREVRIDAAGGGRVIVLSDSGSITVVHKIAVTNSCMCFLDIIRSKKETDL